MPVRSPSELTDHLDIELGWRKRELTTVKFQVQRARSHVGTVMVRSGVCLLYAHWEGFVGSAARKYLEYVANRRLRYRELKRNFLVVGARPKIRVVAHDRGVDSEMKLIDYLLDEESKFSVSSIAAIEIRSNLDCDVLTDILLLLGIDSTAYRAKKFMITDRLVRNRNKIAHGEKCDMSSDEYVDLYNCILGLMERFRDDLQDAVAAKSYRC